MTNLLKNKRFFQKTIVLLFIAGALSACNEQTVYHAYQSIPAEGWLQKDTLLFEVEVPDSQTHYKLSLEVRNRSNYPYLNIYLSIKQSGPDASLLTSDTLQLSLAHKDGTWKGKGWGGLYQSVYPAGDVKIDKAGTYHFKIAYTLPDEKLQGINDIGILLER